MRLKYYLLCIVQTIVAHSHLICYDEKRGNCYIKNKAK